MRHPQLIDLHSDLSLGHGLACKDVGGQKHRAIVDTKNQDSRSSNLKEFVATDHMGGDLLQPLYQRGYLALIYSRRSEGIPYLRLCDIERFACARAEEREDRTHHRDGANVFPGHQVQVW